MTRRKIKDAADARACLEAAAESGLDRAAWARAHGVDARSLNAWRLNLGRSTETAAPLRLLELVSPAGSVAVYRVHTRGFMVEVEDDFDDHVLARLLAVVAGC